MKAKSSERAPLAEKAQYVISVYKLPVDDYKVLLDSLDSHPQR